MFKMFSAIAVFGLLTGSTAFAQSNQALQANVPFAFTVHNRTLSSGTYRVSYKTTAHVLYIRGLNLAAESAFVFAIPGADPKGTSGQSRLVFRCNPKGACELAQVWQGYGEGAGVLVSQPEREHKLSFVTRVVSMSIPK
jgi:hypothetical protein